MSPAGRPLSIPIPTFVLVDPSKLGELKGLPEPIRMGNLNPIAVKLANGDALEMECSVEDALRLTKSLKGRGFRVHIRRVPEKLETHVYVWADKSAEAARVNKP